MSGIDGDLRFTHVDPETQDGHSLPTSGSDECRFRPFLRPLPNFKFWFSISRTCLTDHRDLSRATAVGYLFLLLLTSSFINVSSSCSWGACQIYDSCTKASDCGPGLYCENCPILGKIYPFCIRNKATIPTSIINGLPFNRYSWLLTHNSFSMLAAPTLPGVQRVTIYNQEDSVTNQLVNGVRGLMLDMYDFKGDIWLCHSSGGLCFTHTAFQPASNTLREVEGFLSRNPTQIVTLIIQDYVRAPKGLTKLFATTRLTKYLFPLSKMPKNGGDWPTVKEMLQANHRCLVFSSAQWKEADEGIAYQWNYFLENEAGDSGVQPGKCHNRKESQPLSSKKASLFLMNYFATLPAEDVVCKEHSKPLTDMVQTCYRAAGNKMPNFLAVDFYLRSDGAGVFGDLDTMNGRTLCGCSTIKACQPGKPFGTCRNVSSRG
ncbi:PI-PLC X domain-containing protein At5g67130-like [Hibiscus syriacus]|uniref:PI-PLC X domain-containing protein At5g67130-like n=1 Tax=Hibiscus syriacus TaxID=106335 RepID=UPI0019208D79|nr:PI-PLC X domain-containing protein At5g67130-like [Hibiscus syriacus]